jgi:hypothetical protein
MDYIEFNHIVSNSTQDKQKASGFREIDEIYISNFGRLVSTKEATHIEIKSTCTSVKFGPTKSRTTRSGKGFQGKKKNSKFFLLNGNCALCANKSMPAVTYSIYLDKPLDPSNEDFVELKVIRKGPSHKHERQSRFLTTQSCRRSAPASYIDYHGLQRTWCSKNRNVANADATVSNALNEELNQKKEEDIIEEVSQLPPLLAESPAVVKGFKESSIQVLQSKIETWTNALRSSVSNGSIDLCAKIKVASDAIVSLQKITS